jgi:hypothetical protein
MTQYLLIILKSGLPIAATSFLLVWWALRQDYLDGASSLGEYDQMKKAEKQSRKAEKKRLKAAKRNGLPENPATAADGESLDELQPTERKFDPLHSKWMQFGGGFYGVVALFTYALIELGEVRDFILNLTDLFHGGLISMVVNFFIESIKNFVAAISWPAYWMQRIHGEQWLWIVSAYAGYWLGARAAFRFSSSTPTR